MRIKKVKSKAVRIVLDLASHKRFKVASTRENRSMSGMVRELVRRFLEEQERTHAEKQVND